jgi:hypothetical protein
VILGWVKHTLMNMEMHELREYLRFDGQLIDDPHRENGDQK